MKGVLRVWNRKEKQKEAVFHVRYSIHAKRPLYLISVIQFFLESVDFLLVIADAVNLYTAQDCRADTSAEKQTDHKVQHRFITSLSSGDCSLIKSPNVIDSPVKFGEASSVKEIYPCSPKLIGSFVTTDPA